MGRLQQLHEAGVSIWLDTLSRELLETGEFERLVREFAVTGATSNPTIFAKAITKSDRYDAQLRELVARGLDDPQALFLELALEDIRQAAEVLRPTYERSLRSRWIHLARVHAGPGRRHRRNDRAGAGSLGPARSPQCADQGPRHAGGRQRR